MIPKYGNYPHAEGELEISITQDVVENEALEPIEIVKRVQLQGKLLAASAVAMDAKVKALLKGYNANGKNFIVYLPGGSVASQLTLLNAGSSGGVRITQLPSFPTIRGAGYVTNLDYTIGLEARYPVGGTGRVLKSFEETVTFSGGGPMYGWLKPLVGRPQKQQLMQQDTYRATQTGSAVGYSYRPSAPGPLWQGALLRAPTITVKSPSRFGSAYRDYAVSWQFEFESDAPLRGNPNSWEF